ncbi:MAG: arsenosugar biosynthesis radical SAM protein ArsS [Lagierella massiliensis]|nr:arsenosugar biosynthesis radical SAM protein ArsS [Lagierella massiliensis]
MTFSLENKNVITPFFKRAGELISNSKPSTMQINLTRRCNLSCKHCHLSCGPHMTEDMDMETAKACIKVFKSENFKVLDLTGGSPEMSKVFKYLVEELRDFAENIIVRTNLSIYLKKGYDLEFLKENKVEVFASLPFYEKSKTDRVRGDGVYDSSIIVLKKLNELGYGKKLNLNLVYNPSGAILPGNQKELEDIYRKKLKEEYGIIFNNLYSITNMPIGRFKNWLLKSSNYDRYMKKLETAFNDEVLKGLMCLDAISVDYDGKIYDCDFNLSMGLNSNQKLNIKTLPEDFDFKRKISIGNHCYGCTAGAGSS